MKCLLSGLPLLLLTPTWAQEISPQADPPSLELLEFIAEFGAIDEETFNIIEYHAQQDIEQNQPESPDEN